MTRQPTTKQRLEQHLKHNFHIGVPIKPRATLSWLQVWHRQAHKRVLTHDHEGEAGILDGSWGRVVDISLCPPKNPSSNNRMERNWTLMYLPKPHLVQFIPLAGTYAGDADGAKKAANTYLGYDPGWVPNGWGWKVKND